MSYMYMLRWNMSNRAGNISTSGYRITIWFR